MSRITAGITVCAARTACLLAALAATGTQAGGTGARDCEPKAVRAGGEERSLTPAERIARMDEAFYDSLARFDECRSAAVADGGREDTANTGAGTAGGNPGTAGAGSGTADAGSGASIESAPAQGVQGDGAPEPGGTAAAAGKTRAPDGGAFVESVPAQGVQGTEPRESGETATATTKPGRASPPGSGKIPEDIPGPDNDGVLAAQIRRAAMEETDPRLQAELWNEYRRYKGLPVKPLPGEGEEDTDAQESG